LGANSLLDLVVFGRGTGKNIVEKHFNKQNIDINVDNSTFDKSIDSLNDFLDVECDESTTADIRLSMQHTMQKYSSVFKSKELLEIGFDNIEKLLDEKIKIKDKSIVWNTDLLEALELRNMVQLAYLTVGASLFREESRGSHYRYDFPERDDDNWMYHTLSWLRNGKLTNIKSNVNFDGLYKEMETVPPAKRVY